MRIGFFGDSLTAGMPGSSYFAWLRERFPGHTLLNYGKGNDTVISLYCRISHAKLATPLDLAFLWIGVNDVSKSDRWLYRTLNTLAGQRRARDLDEFRTYLCATLDILCARAGRVIVAPPALRGENLENRWNRRLADVAGLIQAVAAGYGQVEFLDLRAAFRRELIGMAISDYTPSNPLRVVLDMMVLRTDEQIDAMAAQRGLHLTLDGVHLNSAGARLVAEEMGGVVERLASL